MRRLVRRLVWLVRNLVRHWLRNGRLRLWLRLRLWRLRRLRWLRVRRWGAVPEATDLGVGVGLRPDH